AARLPAQGGSSDESAYVCLGWWWIARIEDLSRRRLRVFFRRTRVDVERVDVRLHERADRREHDPVPLDRRLAAKGRRREAHLEMPTLARTRVADVLRAVVDDLEPRGRKLLLEGRAEAADAFGCHAGSGLCRGRRGLLAHDPEELGEREHEE